MNGSKQTIGALGMVTGLLIVLGVLAVLQYRWTGELSMAEKERMRRSVGESARRLSQDLDDPLAEIIEELRPDPMGARPLQEQVESACADLGTTAFQLLGEVWLVRIDTPDAQSAQLDLETMEWSESDPPKLVRRLDRGGPGTGRGLRFQPLLPEIPAVVIPAGPRRSPLPGEPPARGPGNGPSALVVALLDLEFISTSLLPDLVQREFGDDDSRAWSIEVYDRARDRVLYRSDPAETNSPPDLEVPLLGMRPGISTPVPDMRDRPAGRSGPGGQGRRGAGRGFRGPPAEPGRPVAGPWTMRIWHRAGTLEEAVERSRVRNLAMSAGVLLLLLTGGLMIIMNAHRSRQLARQQLDFVAAVTHELNTPIAAISSAGQNLSDGVVSDEEQIRRYGSMIEREGKRLASMVDQVLEFAGMRRAMAPLSISRVLIAELVDEAIASSAWLIEENELTVEREVQDGDKELACDRDELVRALANLISNAIKYRGSSRRIVIATRLDSNAGNAVFSISDEGLGIPADDQQRIFEPFVRGSNARDGAIRGSGLGLSIVRRIVQAHGGRVDVDSRLGEGSVFSVSIPVK